MPVSIARLPEARPDTRPGPSGRFALGVALGLAGSLPVWYAAYRAIEWWVRLGPHLQTFGG